MLKAKQILHKLSGPRPKDFFTGVTFTPDGKLVAAGSQEGEGRVYVWDTRTGNLRFELQGKSWILRNIAISPDGKKLAASFASNRLRIWDLSTGKPILENLIGHDSSVSAVAYAPDGLTIASGSGNQQILLWDARTGDRIQSLNTNVSSSSLHFLSDGRRLVSGWRNKEGVSIWDWRTGKRLTRLMQFGLPKNGHGLWALRFSPEEGTLFVAGFDKSRQTVQFSSWDFQSQQRSLKFIEGDVRNPNVIAISPSCDVAAIADGQDIRIWDLEGGGDLAKLAGHEHHVKSLAFSPDGKRVVSGSLDGSVRMWNCDTFEEVNVLNANQPIAVVAVSPDGNVIAAGGGAREYPVASANRSQVEFWNAKTAKKIGVVPGNLSNVTSMSFSPDGHRIVSGHQDGSVVVWRVPTAEN